MTAIPEPRRHVEEHPYRLADEPAEVRAVWSDCAADACPGDCCAAADLAALQGVTA